MAKPKGIEQVPIMFYNFILWFWFVFNFLKHEVEMTIIDRKFFNQKHVTERCREGVIPSVFLGRQVVDAYSHSLVFEQLDLPYSCFVNVRTEPGSKIIVVVNFIPSEQSLADTCNQVVFKDQLIVYEMGETFGGYWGALPNDVLRPNKTRRTNSYTLKTTRHSPPTSKRSPSFVTIESDDEDDATATTLMKDSTSDSREEYMTMELPLLNVSMRVVPGELPLDVLFDREELFDVHYDVTPGVGIEYATKILPLVQFSRSDFAVDANESNIRFNVKYGPSIFTPDTRITLPRLSSNLSKKRKYNANVNRRIKFNTSKPFFAVSSTTRSMITSQFRKNTNKIKPIISRRYGFTVSSSQNTKSWDVIDDLLRNLSNSKYRQEDNDYGLHLSNLLRGLVGKNSSSKNTHLSRSPPHQTKYATPQTRIFSNDQYKMDSISWTPFPPIYRSNFYLQDVEISTKYKYGQSSEHESKTSSPFRIVIDDDFTTRAEGLLLPILDIDKELMKSLKVTVNDQATSVIVANKITSKQSTTKMRKLTTTRSSKPSLGSLVNHESWENIVQSAPVMVNVLNKTVPNENPPERIHLPRIKFNKTRRKKRFIHGINIENARPHHLPAKYNDIDSFTNSRHVDRVVDNPRHLFELQDDGIVDRLSLRHPELFLGSALFNICHINDANTRHVYLFNTSRLTLALTNFTLDTLSIILTPAYTLMSSDARCSPAELECQVSGARVCIDSLNACDGIPNCGSHDIYDEDRLMCGVSGDQHSVYLTAFISVTVLLVFLYAIHYWLKRCVPRVSSAFFIYTESTENILNIRPIMRSPHENYYENNLGNTALEDYDMAYDDMDVKQERTVTRFLIRLLRILLCRRREKHYRSDSVMSTEMSRLYLFHDLDRAAHTSDAIVQTGPSLEMEQMLYKQTEDDPVVRQPGLSHVDKFNLDMDVASYSSDELSMLKFFKHTRACRLNNRGKGFEFCEISSKCPSRETEEREIQNLEYDSITEENSIKPILSNARSDQSKESPKETKTHVKKHLRFQGPVSIPSSSDEDEKTQQLCRRSAAFKANRGLRIEDTHVEEVPEHSGNVPKETKAFFWNKHKNKKSKKKPFQRL